MSDARIYVLYGADRYRRDEQVRGLKLRILDEPAGEYNLTELTGPDVRLQDVRAAADSIPFLADRRLVIVHGLVARATGSQKSPGRRGRGAKVANDSTSNGELQEILKYLPLVPPTTALVLVEDQIDVSSVVSAIPRERAYVKSYGRPRGAELQRWIERRAQHHGGSIQSAATRRLSLLPSDDLGLIDNEILKLVTYADGAAVTVDDVDLLASSPDVTLFAFVDAVAERKRGAALAHLRRLTARGERPEVVVGQIAGTLHNLICARDLLDEGGSPQEVKRQLGLHSFVADKVTRQAETWRADQLERSLRALLATDISIKTGAADPDTAIELFIVGLPGS